MSNVDKTLADRGTRYGAFVGHARITQELKAAMHRAGQWNKLRPDQKEALEMVAHKIGRILNGNPDYVDSWHDIIGYTRLVEQDLEKRHAPAEAADPIVGTIEKMRATQEMSQRVEAKQPANEVCECPACQFERVLTGQLKAAGFDVRILGEDSGRTD